MANDDNNKPTEKQESDADTNVLAQTGGLSAEEAAERPYEEEEAFKKSLNPLLILLGSIALVVAGVSYMNHSEEQELTDRSLRFLTAFSETEGAEDRFLSFSGDFQDELGGIAQYQAGVIQYRDKRYSEAAENFKGAAERMRGNPLYGRVALGHAVSLIKGGGTIEQGKKALQALAEEEEVLPTDRAEARFLLALQAIGEEDESSYEKYRTELGEDQNASYFLVRLEELKRTKNLLSVAKSLPDINADIGAKFLAENKKREGVTETESGLQYEVLKEGTGEMPSAEDEVEVHYHGTLVNGEVFDSSVERGEPAKFPVNGVIKGWTEALQLMKVGAKWKLYIPSDSAYGERGNNSIGPNEVLIFEVELLGITPAEKPEEIISDANQTIDREAEGNQSVDAEPAPVVEPVVVEQPAPASAPVPEVPDKVVEVDANESLFSPDSDENSTE